LAAAPELRGLVLDLPFDAVGNLPVAHESSAEVDQAASYSIREAARWSRMPFVGHPAGGHPAQDLILTGVCVVG
jgi:hypothetical protein